MYDLLSINIIININKQQTIVLLQCYIIMFITYSYKSYSFEKLIVNVYNIIQCCISLVY